MKFTERAFTLFSFILISLGISNVMGTFWRFDSIDPIYVTYLFFGVVSCYLTFKSKVLGFWLFIIFYLIQVVRVFSPEFNYNFTTGLSMFFFYHDGDRYTPVAERRGFGINLLSVGMIAYAIILLVLRRQPVSDDKKL